MSEQKPTFMEEVELDLKERMVGVPEDKQAELITYVKAKVLASYRNGQAAPKRATGRSSRTASN